MAKKLDFQASISDVKQINPLFSTCKTRILYTGKNRNLSIITKDAVEKALPTLTNIPIVGEFNQSAKDYKGHGGAIDVDTWDFIHTTKPYGVVPESATYSWEEVKGSDGTIREYLTVEGCVLWTGRYEEAFSVVQDGKGQSMEIEILDGDWDEDEEAFKINNFTFSALCILGNDVEPCFEDANITSYSLNEDSFKKEFQVMMDELNKFQNQDKGENNMLKDLLKKYNLTIEQLTEKGINFNEISEDELEAKIVEVFELDADADNKEDHDNQDQEKDTVEIKGDVQPDEGVVSNDETEPAGKVEDVKEGTVVETPSDDDKKKEDTKAEKEETYSKEDVDALKLRISQLESSLVELEALKEFKLNTEKAEHEDKVNKLFSNFQLCEDDVKDLDIHKFSYEEIEEKCYAILGRKMASKNNFSKGKGTENTSIKLPFGKGNVDEKPENPYGDLFDRYNK